MKVGDALSMSYFACQREIIWNNLARQKAMHTFVPESVAKGFFQRKC